MVGVGNAGLAACARAIACGKVGRHRPGRDRAFSAPSSLWRARCQRRSPPCAGVVDRRLRESWVDHLRASDRPPVSAAVHSRHVQVRGPVAEQSRAL